MRIGLWIDDDGRTPDAMAERFRMAAERGYSRGWLSQRGGWDALTLLAAVGPQAPGIGVGTAVVPTYPRHPLMLASQALTVQAATGGRLALGVGPSHQLIIEGQFGYSFDRPARHTREYLSVLAPLLRGEAVDYRGSAVAATGQFTESVNAPPELFLSALGPAMLQIAAELAAGTITTWAGPRTIGDYFVPRVGAGEVIANVCMCVTDDVAGGKEWIRNAFGRAGDLPSYRAAMDRDGVNGPEDTAIIGDEAAMERAVRQFADAGASELLVCPVGTDVEQERTIAVLGELAGRSG